MSGARGLTRIPVVWHWQDLTQKYEQDCKAAKAAAVWAKKQKILEKEGKNVSNQVTLEQVGCGQLWAGSSVCKCRMLFNRARRE